MMPQSLGVKPLSRPLPAGTGPQVDPNLRPEDFTAAKEAALKQRGAEIITAFPEDFDSSSSGSSSSSSNGVAADAGPAAAGSSSGAAAAGAEEEEGEK